MRYALALPGNRRRVAASVAGLGALLLGLRWWGWWTERGARDAARGNEGASTGEAGDAPRRPDGWVGRHVALGGAASARLGLMLVAVPAIAVATFVASYPYLWPDPVGRTEKLFEFRVREMRSQATRYSGLAV